MSLSASLGSVSFSHLLIFDGIDSLEACGHIFVDLSFPCGLSDNFPMIRLGYGLCGRLFSVLFI